VKVDFQGAHSDNAARETTEIENDSRRALDALEPTGFMSPLRRAPAHFITPLGGNYFRLCWTTLLPLTNECALPYARGRLRVFCETIRLTSVSETFAFQLQFPA